jgi:phage-related protein
MQYTVLLLTEAEKEKSKLTKIYQDELEQTYTDIEEIGIACVNINSLGNCLYEIKAGKTRSIFKYQKGQIIIVGVIFLKKSQETPQKILKLAQKRLKEI